MPIIASLLRMLIKEGIFSPFPIAMYINAISLYLIILLYAITVCGGLRVSTVYRQQTPLTE